VQQGRLRERGGRYLPRGPGYPAAEIALRSASPDSVAIVEAAGGEGIGTVEPARALSSVPPGAEEGAGPEIHVAEPWKGYDRMNVKEIRSRLGRASAAELAAVQLHEAAGKNRRSVLAAVKARLSAPPSG
ncbi:MAG TPA: hypothetical protein VEQ61_05500, partial [Thermoleophilaceae bacterium]|nr:hypothetical protein [Thermoleophilaceae bacterium]